LTSPTASLQSDPPGFEPVCAVHCPVRNATEGDFRRLKKWRPEQPERSLAAAVGVSCVSRDTDSGVGHRWQDAGVSSTMNAPGLGGVMNVGQRTGV
jgi:hypothetical protein